MARSCVICVGSRWCSRFGSISAVNSTGLTPNFRLAFFGHLFVQQIYLLDPSVNQVGNRKLCNLRWLKFRLLSVCIRRAKTDRTSTTIVRGEASIVAVPSAPCYLEIWVPPPARGRKSTTCFAQHAITVPGRKSSMLGVYAAPSYSKTVLGPTLAPQ